MGSEEYGWKEGKRRKRLSRRLRMPQELVFDILITLAPKPLLRFKSVCKLWEKLISDPYFVESYSRYLEQQKEKKKVPSTTLLLQMIPSSSRIVFYRMYHDKNSFSSLKFSFTKDFPGLLEDFWSYQSSMDAAYIMTGVHNNLQRRQLLKASSKSPIPIHSKGLLLMATNSHIYVCNPTTREVVELPPIKYRNGKSILNSVGFGFDLCTNKYKAVWCFMQPRDPIEQFYRSTVLVFTLGGGDSDWRETIVDLPYPLESGYPTSIGGGIYWKIANDRHASPFEGFMRFGLSDEKFSVIEPPPTPQQHNFTCLTQLEESLCCLISTGEGPAVISVWTTKNFETHAWTLAYTITVPKPQLRFKPITIHEGNLLYHYSNGLFWHNPRNNLADELKVCMDGSATRFAVDDIYYRATSWVKSIVPIMAAPSN